jgi:tetratricopeptide (TPR) repeat protein
METANLYETFEAYLNGDLSNEEKNSFERKLVEDKEALEKFNLYKENSAFLKVTLSKEKQDFLANLHTARKANTSANKPKVLAMWPKVISMAAVITLSVMSWYFYNHFNPQYSDYATHQDIHLIERGTSNLDLAQAEKLFNEKKYKEAIPYFEKIKNLNSAEANIGLAVCYLETNNLDAAIKTLEVEAKKEGLYQDKAYWYLGLTYLKQNQPTEARKALLNISQDYENTEQVNELIERLD